MKVIKLGGGCLKNKETIKHILGLVAERGRGNVFVVSALFGITDMLIQGMEHALRDEESIPKLIQDLRNKHTHVANHLLCNGDNLNTYRRELDTSLRKLQRLYFGLNFTEEQTPRISDAISSYGEQLSATLLAYALRCQGVKATARMPHKIGMITDGKYGDATANIPQIKRNLQEHLNGTLSQDSVLFLPGFFGVSPDGDITTFGRGGSDYSAAVAAVALEADVLEIWKDVAGFMSVDPRMAPHAQLIPTLSYEEAAELAYFGAKILHPRTIEPIRKQLEASKGKAQLEITIRNTMNPDAQGTRIIKKSPTSKHVIKSIAHAEDICLLKVHASGVGARPGILSEVAGALSTNGVNIKSVVSSQTCITFLLACQDLQAGHKALKSMKDKPFRTIEKVEDVSLVGVVGDGLHRNKGIAGRCFTAVADHGVNVDMISFGPSKAALYFLVRSKDLETAVGAIHGTFFGEE